MNFIEHLAVEIEQTGHKVTWAGTGFSMEPIGLKVDAGVGERVVHDGFNGITVVFTIRIKATHDIMFPEGIWDELAGFGVDDDEAFSYASMIWASGTFPPIHETWCRQPPRDSRFRDSIWFREMTKQANSLPGIFISGRCKQTYPPRRENGRRYINEKVVRSYYIRLEPTRIALDQIVYIQIA